MPGQYVALMHRDIPAGGRLSARPLFLLRSSLGGMPQPDVRSVADPTLSIGQGRNVALIASHGHRFRPRNAKRSGVTGAFCVDGWR
jgi:hypothetical protein